MSQRSLEAAKHAASTLACDVLAANPHGASGVVKILSLLGVGLATTAALLHTQPLSPDAGVRLLLFVGATFALLLARHPERP
jgi:hypothetical protein